MRGKSALRAFDLSTGEPKLRWDLPGDNTACNDFALGPDHALYITDTFGGRIFKLPAGASAAKLYLEHQALKGVDGIAFLNGVLYVNNVFSGKLYRIPANAGGEAGQPIEISTDQPLKGPDGMRPANGTLFLAENGAGMIASLTISGDRAMVTVLKDGLKRPTGIEPAGDTVWYTELDAGKVGSIPMPGTQVQSRPLLTGQSAFTDWNQQAPGVRHKITLADLPQPKPEESVRNQPTVIARPKDALPIAPPGFKVTLYAGGDNGPLQRYQVTEHMMPALGTFTQPRIIRSAPNGDLFVADSGVGAIDVLRGVGSDGKYQQFEHFATGLDHPFGIAFYPAEDPRYIYVANATTVVRIPYHNGDVHASGPPETVIPDIPGYAQLAGGGHWTRDVAFTKDGRHLLVSVGSGSNVDDPDTHPSEFHRAAVLEYTPEGKFERVYAHGIRNCVGEAVNPITGDLWCSTNERDGLGNHLVPDYVTSVPEGSFFGWPWYYMGGHHDPHLPDPCANGTGSNPQRTSPLSKEEAANCQRVDISSKVRTPDVLVQPHMASLEMVFYPALGSITGNGQFPREYQGGIFVAEHGSWNRANRAGYEVIFIPMENGHASGEYDDFLTGFVTKDGRVWGRPVGVAVGKDGSLFVVDDGSRTIWHVQWIGR
ncbi:MAG TPA: sorbosone dehydrogenase family protein [Terriglobia bacterium]|nr:sorbosone dehydrogenase family protein [Terriglobia bacterium]